MIGGDPTVHESVLIPGSDFEIQRRVAPVPKGCVIFSWRVLRLLDLSARQAVARYRDHTGLSFHRARAPSYLGGEALFAVVFGNGGRYSKDLTL